MRFTDTSTYEITTMARTPVGQRRQLGQLDKLLALRQQERALDTVRLVRRGLQPLFEHLRALRHLCQAGGDVTGASHQELADLVLRGTSILLGVVPAASKWELLARATVPLDCAPLDSPELDDVVRAEFTLRRLAVLCVEAAGEPYRGRARLPGWRGLIAETREEFEDIKAITNRSESPFGEAGRAAL